jgi:hypothetical protein
MGVTQSEVEYEYFADRFSVRCQSSFSKVSIEVLKAAWNCLMSSSECTHTHLLVGHCQAMRRMAWSRMFLLGRQGEQVFISYGRQSNDSLLQHYGFVEPSISHDTYTLPDLRAAALAVGDSSKVPGIASLPQSSKVPNWTLYIALRSSV